VGRPNSQFRVACHTGPTSQLGLRYGSLRIYSGVAVSFDVADGDASTGCVPSSGVTLGGCFA